MPKKVEVVAIERESHKTTYGLTGATFDFKEDIKDYRGVWLPDVKAWELSNLSKEKCEQLASDFNNKLAAKELHSKAKRSKSAQIAAAKRKKSGETKKTISASNADRFIHALEIHSQKKWIPFFQYGAPNGICRICHKNIFDVIDPEKLQWEIESCPFCATAWSD